MVGKPDLLIRPADVFRVRRLLVGMSYQPDSTLHWTFGASRVLDGPQPQAMPSTFCIPLLRPICGGSTEVGSGNYCSRILSLSSIRSLGIGWTGAVRAGPGHDERCLVHGAGIVYPADCHWF